EWVHVQLHQQKGMISLSPPTICNSAFVSDGSEAMRFKSFQQQFFKHKRINFPQVVNFLWEARQRLYALQHPPRTLLLPFVSPVPY
ncbi:hypothetical protein AAGQ21_26805, partial [Klebsiella pneumoniae]